MNNDLRTHFELSRQESSHLFQLEYLLTAKDVKKESKSEEEKDIKNTWLEEWEKRISGEKVKGIRRVKVIVPEETLIKNINNTEELKRKILLFEAALFTPYFNLNIRELNKSTKELYNTETREHWKKRVLAISKKVDVKPSELENALIWYENAVKAIGGRSSFMRGALIVVVAAIALGATGGMLAPVIGGFAGSLMGLYGAAATSAGLAFLGGGAIAAGGFGMAGGTFVLIGGGALLGALGGGITSSRLFFQHKIVLSQLAKLETVICVFVKRSERIAALRFALDRHAETLKSLKKEADRLSKEDQDSDDNSESVGNLEKSIGYYEVAMKRLTGEQLNLARSVG